MSKSYAKRRSHKMIRNALKRQLKTGHFRLGLGSTWSTTAAIHHIIRHAPLDLEN